jgi:hypothetical protein
MQRTKTTQTIAMIVAAIVGIGLIFCAVVGTLTNPLGAVGFIVFAAAIFGLAWLNQRTKFKKQTETVAQKKYAISVIVNGNIGLIPNEEFSTPAEADIYAKKFCIDFPDVQAYKVVDTDEARVIKSLQETDHTTIN